MGAFQRLVHLELGAACDHLLAVFDEVLDELLEVEQLGTPVDEGDVVDGEARLELGELEELVEDDVGDDVVAEDVDDADAVLVALVADVEDAFDLAFLDEVGGFLDHLALVDTVGDGGGDDEVVAFGVLLDFGDGADDDAAAAGGVGLTDAIVAVDNAAEGEVGGLDIVHEPFDGDVAVVDVGHAAVEHLGEVVGGHVGGHTDGDTVGTVDEEVGNLGGQHGGFLAFVVVGGDHVDGVLVDVGHELVGDLLEAGLGVTHGCRGVAVDGAEVTLAVDQRVAHGPFLRQAHEGAIDAGVAVGVVLTHDVADDTCGLLGRGVVEDSVFVHGVEDAAVHGLEAVAHIGQGTGHDDGHGVVDIRGLHGGLDIHSLNLFVVRYHL